MKQMVWEPSRAVEDAFWSVVRMTWGKELAAVVSGSTAIPSFEQRGGERTAAITFRFEKSSTTARFRYANGAWSCENYPCD